MKALAALVALCLGALLLAATLHYPLYLLLSQFGEVRADRVLYRSAMVFAALGLWPLMRALRLNDLATLGLAAGERGPWPLIGRGLLYGIAILAALGATQLLLGVRVFRPWDAALAMTLAKLLLTALAAGMLIGLIEEVFFRGAIFSALRRSHGWLTTALLSSLCYAFLHFVRPTPPPETLDWLSGFSMLAGSLHKYAAPAMVYDSFIALFAAGMLLALVRERTGSIFVGMGMHAGWVLIIRLLKKSTQLDPASPLHWLIGHYDGVIGWLATAWLALLCLIVFRRGPRTSVSG